MANLLTQMSLGELLAGYVEVPSASNRMISGITGDSREVCPGDLFVAEPQPSDHGIAWIPAALESGAVAAIYDADGPVPKLPDRAVVIAVPGLSRRLGKIVGRFVGEPSQHLRVTGVTGTDGKTSVAWLLAQSRNLLGEVSGLMGTLGYGLHGHLTPGLHTTPPAIITQKWLAKLRDEGAEHVAMEVSSHGLDQGRVGGLRFDTAVLTNLGRDHLDYHGSLEAYAAAKRQLFAQASLRLAVINVDDAFGQDLLGRLAPSVEIIAYGLQKPAKGRWKRLFCKELKLRPGGLQLSLGGDFGKATLQVPLLGRFNASNLLAVLVSLLGSGVSLGAACDVLPTITPPPGRMECFAGKDLPMAVVDYAHTPGALSAALSALRAHRSGRLTCVFGCGGERDSGKRPLMAQAAAAADRIIITDDNPRGEDPEQIVRDIVSGLDGVAYEVIRDRGSAIVEAMRGASDDTVLVAGKGHETVQLLDGKRLPWSDRDAVAVILARQEVAHA